LPAIELVQVVEMEDLKKKLPVATPESLFGDLLRKPVLFSGWFHTVKVDAFAQVHAGLMRL